MKKQQNKIKTINLAATNDANAIHYAHALALLTKEMIAEYNISIKDFYRLHRNYFVGDDDPVVSLTTIINRIGKKWYGIFIKKSDVLARNVVYSAKDFSDRQFKKIVENNPFVLSGTEDLQQMTKVLQSSIAENVSLITSIPEQYHNKILGSVMRSAGEGGNLQELAADLSKISKQTKKRINLIAHDQNAKATALINQRNAIDAGFIEAVWNKSVAGKTHRLSHAQADGRVFDLTKGCSIDGEYILPRQKIGCKCSYKLVVKIT